MYGEIKDDLSLRIKALELAIGIGVQAPMPDETPEIVIARAKAYEDYIRGNVKFDNKKENEPFSLVSNLALVSALISIKDNGMEFTPEIREILIKSGADPSLIDSVFSKSNDSKDDDNVDALCDAVNEHRVTDLGNDAVLIEWLHPELRNNKHRYELKRGDETIATGDDLSQILPDL